MRGLEIRCQFALLVALIPNIRLVSLRLAFDACDDGEDNCFMGAFNLGESDAGRAYHDESQNAFEIYSRCPVMFADETHLIEAWTAGFQRVQEWLI